MDLGLGSNPNLHRTQKGPFRVRIEARQRWLESTKVSRKTWFEADPSCSVTEMKKMMMANVKGSGAWLPTRVLQKSGTHSTKERSFTELRFASFRARL
jgi:hypothetical protein